MGRGGANLAALLGGATSGLIEGLNMSRQRQIDAAAEQHRHASMKMQQELANSLIKMREEASKRQAAGDYSDDVKAMIQRMPELAGELGEVSSLGSAFAGAPPTSPTDLGGGAFGPTQTPGQDFYLAKKDAALKAAAAHAERIRTEGYKAQQELVEGRVDARVKAMLEQKKAQTDEMAKRDIQRRLTEGSHVLPEGVSLEQAVGNITSGGVPDEGLMLRRVPKDKILESSALFDATMQEVQRIGELSKRVNTGKIMEWVTAIPRFFGAEPEDRRALRGNLVGLVSSFIKAQTGVQYGFKEAQWLEDAAPKMEDEDANFDRALAEFARRARVVMEARAARLRQGRQELDLQIPEVETWYQSRTSGVTPVTIPQPGTPSVPPGFEPSHGH